MDGWMNGKAERDRAEESSNSIEMGHQSCAWYRGGIIATRPLGATKLVGDCRRENVENNEIVGIVCMV